MFSKLLKEYLYLNVTKSNIKSYLKDNKKKIMSFLLLSFGLTTVGTLVEEPALFQFLRTDLLSILITLIAICVPVIGLFCARIVELKRKYPDIDFTFVFQSTKTLIRVLFVHALATIITLLCVKVDAFYSETYWDFFAHWILLYILITSIYAVYDISAGMIKVFADFP